MYCVGEKSISTSYRRNTDWMSLRSNFAYNYALFETVFIKMKLSYATCIVHTCPRSGNSLRVETATALFLELTYSSVYQFCPPFTEKHLLRTSLFTFTCASVFTRLPRSMCCFVWFYECVAILSLFLSVHWHVRYYAEFWWTVCLF
jgi:hypothetical protein